MALLNNTLLQTAVRYLPATSSVINNRQYSSGKRPSWNRAVFNAEDIVEHSAHSSALSSLLKSDFTNVKGYLSKLIGTPHSFLRVCKSLIYNGKHNLQTRSLIILLLSKIAGQANCSNDVDHCGISQRQRSLANLTEMIYAGQEIHRALTNLSPQLFPDPELLNDLNQANKVAVLSGDFLMANASLMLGYLHEPKVVDLISSAMTDFTEGEFYGERDCQGHPIPTESSNLVEWQHRSYLRCASLLAKACKSSMILAGQDQDIQAAAFHVGKHLSFAMQVSTELYPFTNLKNKIVYAPFELASAPVILHLSQDRALLDYIRQHKDNSEQIDYHKVHTAIINGPGVEDAKQLCAQHSLEALTGLKKFKEGPAFTALEDLIYAVHNFEEDGCQLKAAVPASQ